tara:strand:- start:3353 stop:4834 length:1482 start_codon:yes stop_codon:yes gene_type:complete
MNAASRKSWWRFIWPSGLTGQIILFIVLTILISQAINIVLVAGERADAFRRGAAGPLIGQTIIAAELLQTSDGPTEQRLLRVLSSRERRVTIDPEPLAGTSDRSAMTNMLATRLQAESGLTARVEARFVERRFEHVSDDREPSVPRQRGRVAQTRHAMPMDRDMDEAMDEAMGRSRDRLVDRLVVSLELAPQRWLNIVLWLPGRDLDWLRTSLLYNLALALALSGLAIWFLRRVTRPIKDLAGAADALGRGEQVPMLAETGPQEIRRATAAFNAMQDRLTRFVKDRTQMLAAISHDLRTPITSLRLRAELLDDETAKANIVRTLDDMQSMTESVLAFARDDADSEPISQIDLLALLEECAAIYKAQGAEIDFDINATSSPLLRGRPLALKRAISNLMENAILYGDRANISVASADQTVSFEIRDHGPGIPPERMEEMFKPFSRIETSRNRETGGTGLGLSIARSIIHRHGGEISLQNADEGGLIVTVSLPSAS